MFRGSGHFDCRLPRCRPRRCDVACASHLRGAHARAAASRGVEHRQLREREPMKQLVLVTGAAGQLGEAMVAQLEGLHEVVNLSRADLDVADAGRVLATVAAVCPDVIVNCAAYTYVDGAEQDPAAALAANAWAVRALARAAGEINAVLVHFSTDFVFDGAT